MGDSSWKQFERDVAAFFGVMRKEGSGSQGRSDATRADAYHPDIFIEAKRRKTYTPIIQKHREVREACKKTGEIAVLGLDNNSVYVVHSSDLFRLAEAVRVSKEPNEMPNDIHLVEMPSAKSAALKGLVQTEVMAANEGQSIALFVLKEYNCRGFLIVLRKNLIQEVTDWALAGIILISWVKSLGASDTSEYCGPSIREKFETLKNFSHSWKIPKKRKPKRAKVASNLPETI